MLLKKYSLNVTVIFALTSGRAAETSAWRLVAAAPALLPGGGSRRPVPTPALPQQDGGAGGGRWPCNQAAPCPAPAALWGQLGAVVGAARCGSALLSPTWDLLALSLQTCSREKRLEVPCSSTVLMSSSPNLFSKHPDCCSWCDWRVSTDSSKCRAIHFH